MNLRRIPNLLCRAVGVSHSLMSYQHVSTFPWVQSPMRHMGRGRIGLMSWGPADSATILCGGGENERFSESGSHTLPDAHTHIKKSSGKVIIQKTKRHTYISDNQKSDKTFFPLFIFYNNCQRYALGGCEEKFEKLPKQYLIIYLSIYLSIIIC